MLLLDYPPVHKATCLMGESTCFSFSLKLNVLPILFLAPANGREQEQILFLAPANGTREQEQILMWSIKICFHCLPL